MMNSRNFIGLFLVFFLLFTACKKDNITPETTPTTTTPETTETTDNATINPTTQTRAMAAAASVAHARSGENNDTTENDCGCYALFDEVNFDATHAEIEAAIEAALENLTEAEIDHLFQPVCTDDGEIYESACIADCEGITNYHVCSEEELEDYFFGDFDCEDLENLTFPTEIELPDGTKVTVNSEEELFELIEKWYEENEEEWEAEWEDLGAEIESFFEDCFTLIFPISFQFEDSAIVTYNSFDELLAGILEIELTWQEEPEIIYPFEVLLPDSTTFTVNNEMDEEVLWEQCFGDFDDELCFALNYPITLIYPDSTTLIVESDEALEAAIDDYYDPNNETDEDVDVVYPFDITLEDGTIQTINNEEALDAALEACYDGFGRNTTSNRKSVLSRKRAMKKAVLSGKTDN